MWTKVSDDYGDQCARLGLSDAAFRTHLEALLWTMRRESGGNIEERDVRRFAESPLVDAAVQELVDLGCWTKTQEGFRLNLHMEHQIEPEVIARRRESAAIRQRRKRRKDAGLQDQGHASHRDERGDPPGDNPRDSGRDWTGLDGAGRAQLEKGYQVNDCPKCSECGMDPCACWHISDPAPVHWGSEQDHQPQVAVHCGTRE